MNESAQLVGDAFAAWEGGDAQAVFGLMSDDLEWTVIGTTAISGTFHSKREFLDMVNSKLMPALAGPLVPVVERIFACGSTVVAQFTSFAPTPRAPEYRQTYCWVMEIAGGKIQSGKAYLDTALVDRVVGQE